MTRRTRLVLTTGLVFSLSACGGKSSTSPTPTPTQTPTITKTINVFGSMSFGGVGITSSKTNKLTIQNQGNTLLTITGITGSGGITSVIKADWTSGGIQPGANQDVSLTFTPTSVTSYSGTITVNGDQTGGTNTAQFSGQGTLDGIPIFTKSGHGDTVFNLPAYVTRVRIQGRYIESGGNSNFIIHANGGGLISEILRTSITYDGTHVVPGGALIEILSSSSIDWTFTEVRQ